MLRMGSSKRLPRNFKEETSDKNSTEQDDVVLQATWIFHRLLGFWLLVYMEWVTFLLICCVVAIWFFFSFWYIEDWQLCFVLGASLVFMTDAAIQLRNSPVLWLPCRTLPSHITIDPFCSWKQTSVWNALIQSPQHTPFFSFIIIFLYLNSCRRSMQIASALAHNGAGKPSTGKALGFESAHGTGEAHGLQPTRARSCFQESMTNLISTFT